MRLCREGAAAIATNTTIITQDQPRRPRGPATRAASDRNKTRASDADRQPIQRRSTTSVVTVIEELPRRVKT
jgi:hypothetical protein